MNIEKFTRLLIREKKSELTTKEKFHLWLHLAFSAELRSQRTKFQYLEFLIATDIDNSITEEDRHYLEQLKSGSPEIQKLWDERKAASDRSFPVMAYVGNGKKKMVFLTFLDVKNLAAEAGITAK